MKIKRIFSFTLALAILFCMAVMPANAAETEDHDHIEIIFINNNISEETKQKAIDFYTNGGEATDDTATYGLTCTLFGHKLESSGVTTITHKVRSSSPRCLKKTYNYESCTRCDYENSTLVAQQYIACC